MKKTLLLLAFSALAFVSHAQDFTFGTFTEDEMAMKKYAKDTSAHAVYLNEFGKLSLNTTNDEYYKYIYHYHARIKIFDSRGFSHATVEVPLYIGGEVSD